MHEVRRPRPGLSRLRVEVDGRLEDAYALSPLAESVERGDTVLLNCTAEMLALGSREGSPVVANLSRPQHEAAALANEVKVRYTPAQVAVGTTHSELPLDEAVLDGMPVVVAELHSALAPILAAMRRKALECGRRPPRVAYVMTDSNSLPLVLSDTVARAMEVGWLHTTVTCGQAFGGVLEAASLPAGLVLAREHGAEVAVVIGGLGHLGAHQPYGFSAADQSEVLHVAIALGGAPALAPRLSAADPRERHRGVSHHTRAILGCLLLAPVIVPVPEDLPAELTDALRTLAARTGSSVVSVAVPDWLPLCDEADIRVHSMGRGIADDPLYFASVAAAGVWAAVRPNHAGAAAGARRDPESPR